MLGIYHRQFFGFSAKFQAENVILGDFRQFQAILGHFRPFLGQIFRQFFFAKKAIPATELVFLMCGLNGHKSLGSLCSVVKTLIVSGVRRTDTDTDRRIFLKILTYIHITYVNFLFHRLLVSETRPDQQKDNDKDKYKDKDDDKDEYISKAPSKSDPRDL